MTDTANKKLFEKGTLIPVIRRPMITIDLGKVSYLSPLSNIIWYSSHGNVIISTPNSTDGHLFKQNLNAFVKFGGLNFSQVKTNGFYDIQVAELQSVKKHFGNFFDISSLPSDIVSELTPLFNVSLSVKPYFSDVTNGFYVIMVTKQMFPYEKYITCHCSGDNSDRLTRLYPDDIFLVEDVENYTGRKITIEEFNNYYYFE